MSSSTVKLFAPLYGKDKKGKIRVWNCSVEILSNTPTIVVHHGEQDGKLTTSQREVKEGKNLGKKNATTAEEQAVKEAEKMWKDKCEKEEYSPSLEALNRKSATYAPMLAEKYEIGSKSKRKVDISFPCFLQPKLDGIRCLSYLNPDGKVVNQSRKLKSFPHLDHINEELLKLFSSSDRNLIVDGELYNHDINFNEIAGIVKKEKLKPEDEKKLSLIQYHIYDCFTDGNEDLPFQKRWESLLSKNQNFKYLRFVETIDCASEKDIPSHHESYTNKKYEGVMLRNKKAPYEHSRSRHLQKYKTFQDDEFEIVGFKQGEGNDSGCVVWRVVTKDGQEFDVRPAATVEERREMFANAKKYLGKMLTVKYQELSEYGVPRFPVGVEVRDYE